MMYDVCFLAEAIFVAAAATTTNLEIGKRPWPQFEPMLAGLLQNV